MAKRSSLIVLALLVVVVFCSAVVGATTLNVLHMIQSGYSVEEIESITAEFEAENPGVKVNLLFIPFDALHDKIVTAAATRSSAYDVTLIDCIWPPEFASAGFVVDVTDKMAEVNTDDIFQGVLDSVKYDGKYWGMPWLNDIKYLFYNTRMLAEAGFDNPPETWGELVEQAKVIKEMGLVEYPIVWCWAQIEAVVCDFTALAAGFGGEILTLDEENKVVLNEELGLEVLEFMVETIETGITNPSSREFSEEDVRRVFSQGEAAFALNWTYMYNSANDPAESAVAGDVDIAVVPGTDKAFSGTVNGGMGLSILSGSKHPDEAWDYIQHMTSKEVQIQYSDNALPIYISAFSDPRVIADQPRLVEVSETQYGYVVNRPQVTWYPELSEVLRVEIQKVLLGSKSPADAIATIAAETKKLEARQ
ncbi:MAG: ABC transporter substrate-binding protein [Firmicutes bacterium]|nr:ABC transporter substrate-binding protein [Bacillota bacterium]